MALNMMTWAFTKDLKNSQFQVLMAIANEANSEGECFTGQQKLAYLANVTDRTLRTCIKQFREMDLLHTERRPMDFGSGRETDAIVLHWENQDHQKKPYAGAAQQKKEATTRRKKYESKTYGEAENTQAEKFSGRNVSPSQTEPEKFSGRNFNRKNDVVQPEKSGSSTGKIEQAAFTRNARAFNPINPSVSQSTPGTEAPRTDGRMDWDSFIDEMEGHKPTAAAKLTVVEEPKEDSSAVAAPEQPREKPTVVRGVNLTKLREELETTTSLMGVSDDILAEMIRIVLARATSPVRSPQRFVKKSITAEFDELLGQALDTLELSADEVSEPIAQAMKTCPTHNVDYAHECGLCRSERIAAPQPTHDDTHETTIDGTSFREKIRARRLEKQRSA